MFNINATILKKTSLLILLLIFVFSCDKDVKIEFTENNIETSISTIVSINYPKANGTKEVAKRINETLENYIVNQTNLTEDSIINMPVNDAVEQFDKAFERFKKDFPDSTQKWEVLIDGEVTYRSPEVISIAINSYLDTGGAHGNTNVRFFNFNSQTGALLSKKELISDSKRLSEIVEQHLKEEIKANAEDELMEDFFFGKDFQLPETIGFSEEGLIVLYNPYEIASYAQGIIEFTIPFEEVSSFLKVN